LLLDEAATVLLVALPVRALVVHGDAAIRSTIADALRAEGIATAEAAGAGAAERRIAEVDPGLVILDIVLPDGDGFELARRLVEGSRPPAVIFLTRRTAIEPMVAGLSLGDDYVSEPFDVHEIVARVHAVLRRTRTEEGVLRFAEVVLDENSHEVRRAGEPVELTPTEFNLLRFFLLNPRRVLTKSQILENVWDDTRVELSEVETYVSYLRRKLHRNGPPLIRTVRSAGYALREDDR
jgi:two-component system, OmpR family, response regulator